MNPRDPFVERVVELAPATALDYDPAGWRDAIVFVTAGEVELESADGERARFGRGDVLCLAACPLRVLRNPGRVPARLLAIRRATG
jgi:glyoxylate utilization-related uncharacterized protein